MASGRKNYFRHLFNARNDDKVQDLMDKFGPAGYFYWFALVEICAEKASDEPDINFVFHQRTLLKELRLHKNKLKIFLEYSANISLLSYTYTENRVWVCMPKLLKFIGRYSSKNESNTPNKRKEKEIKEKKSKEKEIEKKPISEKEIRKKLDLDFEIIYQNYPRKIGKAAGIKKCKTQIKTIEKYQRLEKAVENYRRLNSEIDQKFIKHFSSFMSEWEDYLEIEVPKTVEDKKRELAREFKIRAAESDDSEMIEKLGVLWQ